MGHYAFSSAAIAISPGTEVRWEWTRQGGAHNVVADLGTFDSGEAVDRATETYTHTFETPAIYTYVCEPHRNLGMRGAIFVPLGQG